MRGAAIVWWRIGRNSWAYDSCVFFSASVFMSTHMKQVHDDVAHFIYSWDRWFCAESIHVVYLANERAEILKKPVIPN